MRIWNNKYVQTKLVAISCKIEGAYVLLPSNSEYKENSFLKNVIVNWWFIIVIFMGYKETFTYIFKEVCIMIVTVALFVIVKIWKLMSYKKINILNGYINHDKPFL